LTYVGPPDIAIRGDTLVVTLYAKDDYRLQSVGCQLLPPLFGFDEVETSAGAREDTVDIRLWVPDGDFFTDEAVLRAYVIDYFGHKSWAPELSVPLD